MYTKVIVASDGSGPAVRASKIAGEIAKAFSGTLTVATVAYFPKVYAGDVGTELREGYLDDWRHALEGTVKAVRGLGVEAEARLLQGGEPAGVLLEEISRGGYDLLVVGSTGAGNPGSKIMGGVSRKLIEAAPCAVLLVK
jgi:nucleotide-binding universal stress UspA family protein